MKRLKVTINDRKVEPTELRPALRAVVNAERQAERPACASGPTRVHRKKSAEATEAKRLASHMAKRQRADDREAREHDQLMRGVALQIRKQERGEMKLSVVIAFKTGREPSFNMVCPKSLYQRAEKEVTLRVPSGPSRVSADGYRNIVLRVEGRGFGNKRAGTRAYRVGEAADMVRYIFREEALECAGAVFLTPFANTKSNIVLDATEQMAGLFGALEKFEQTAADDGNVYLHVILPLPHELSVVGRARVLQSFVDEFAALGLPVAAALHRPDIGGDQRNFHAHLVISLRPHKMIERMSWAFEAQKLTLLNSPAGTKWMRARASSIFNDELARERVAVRFSGISQDDRGVPNLTDRHDGQAVTARKRREERWEHDRRQIYAKLVARLRAAARKLQALMESVERKTDTPGIRYVHSLFPDAKCLAGISEAHFRGYEQADYASDEIYAPAFDLARRLENEWDRVIDVHDDKASIDIEELPPREAYLVKQNFLADIVQIAFQNGVRAKEQDRSDRIERITKEAIRGRRAELIIRFRSEPVRILGDDGQVLPAVMKILPSDVERSSGLLAALHDSHSRWLFGRVSDREYLKFADLDGDVIAQAIAGRGVAPIASATVQDAVQQNRAASPLQECPAHGMIPTDMQAAYLALKGARGI